MGKKKLHTLQAAEGNSHLFRDLMLAVADHEAALAVRFGLRLTEFKCLREIHRRGRIAPRDLAEAAHISRPAVTGVVDKLIELDLITCCANDKDRRSIILVPTDTSVNQMQKFYGSMSAAAAKLYHGYSAQQCDTILNYLQKSVDLLRVETAKLHPRKARGKSELPSFSQMIRRKASPQS